MIKDVDAFLAKFSLKYDGLPRSLENATRDERIRHMLEEIAEYKEAKSVADEFDALIDLIYLAIGTARMQGLDLEVGWDRVHQANMRKVKKEITDDYGNISEYKSGITKPEGWEKPDLTDLTNGD
tara:strand:+ start:5515 stop:5889 length:375 start_codon:yes stop_codon:yes gene_type:complete